MKKKVISTLFITALLIVMAFTLLACGTISPGGSFDNATTDNVATEVDENAGDFSYGLGDNTSTQSVEATEEAVTTALSSMEEWVASTVSYSGKDTATEVGENATIIVLADDGTTITGEGATVEGNVVTITEEGDYVLSGTLSDGRIYVNVNGNVHLYLNGVDITSSDGAAIALFGKKKKVVTLVEGTVNTLTDAQNYTVFYNDDGDEPNGCLFCKNNLTVNGTGTLVVNGNYNNGISCKDDLVIYSGNITVNAKNNGIKGNDNLIIHSGTINVTAEGDGLKSDNEDEGMGNVYIEGGEITVVSGEDGIQAYSRLIVTGGTIHVTSGGGAAANTTVHTDNMWGGTTSTDETSMKGLKSDLFLCVSGGTIEADANDDAVHSNGTIIIENGDLTLKSGDDGIHADEVLSVNDGKITVTKSYEGLESAKVYIYGGEINIIAGDDGINAADGTNSNSMARNANCVIEIDGGKVYVNAQGDGLDSNGDLVINGGTVLVNGPTSGGNTSLDANGNILVNGGVLVAVGSSGMLETPSTSSAQYCLVYTGSNIAANTVLTLKDASGNEVLRFTTAKTSQAVIVSAPDLENGATYTLYAGSNTLGSFTVSGKVTTVGNGSMGGGMGGPGGQGGMGGSQGGMGGPGMRNADGSFTQEDGQSFFPGSGDGQLTPPQMGEGEMPAFPEFDGQAPENDGQTPPQMGNGQMPPQMGNGQTPPQTGNGQTPPQMGGFGQMPEGNGEAPAFPEFDGQAPEGNGEAPDLPETGTGFGPVRPDDSAC